MANPRMLGLLTAGFAGRRLATSRPFFQGEISHLPSRNIASTSQRSTTTYITQREKITPRQLPHHLPQQQSSSAVLQSRPLRELPFADLVRSFLVLSVTTLPKPLLLALVRTANSNAKLLESNRLLRWMVSRTFYQHFCIGSSRDEIVAKTAALRSMGVTGIVLTYAREAPKPEPGVMPPAMLTREDPALQGWVESNFRTIEMLTAGDYIALRVTGAGPTAVSLLERYKHAVTGESGLPGSSDDEIPAGLRQELQVLEDALRKVCAKAKNKNVRVLIDAEGSRYQRAIDEMALSLMAEFNRETDGPRATIMNTYQLYLKRNILKVQRHLRHSVENNYVLGLKLVRGAYMYAEADRGIIHDSKQETDDAYDAAVSFLLGDKVPAEKDGVLKQDAPAENWKADVMLATHNSHSVQQALRRYRSSDAEVRERVCGISFAQLQGMADELSLSLAAQLGSLNLASADNTSKGRQQNSTPVSQHAHRSGPPGVNTYPEIGVYKYTVWGTLSDCLLYMLRRAEENSDAVARSRGTVLAVIKELGRRLVLLGR